MKKRQQEILRAIITHFTETAEPVGSNTILLSYKFNVSPATIRNEMAELEKQGLLYQPHTSSGRVPTDLGYRLYVDNLADYEKAALEAKHKLDAIRHQIRQQRVKQKVHEAVNILSRATQNVSFATIGNVRTFYLGIANALKQPEFSQNPFQTSQIFEVLEDNNNFISLLHSLDIDSKEPKIYIGHENIIEQIKSCGIIVIRYRYDGEEGFIGVLGPTRMEYAINSIILNEVKNLLENNQI